MEWQRRVFDLLEGHAAIIATAAAILLGAWLTVRLLSSREAYSNKFEWSHPVEADREWTGSVLLRPSLHPDQDTSKVAAYDPSTGYMLASFPSLTIDDMSLLVSKAEKASISWRRTTFAQRRQVLRSLLDWCVREKHSIAQICCRDTVLDAALGEILTTCEKLRWLIAYGEHSLKPENRPTSWLLAHKVSYIHYEPFGVVGAIVSWNYPFHNLFSPVIAALMSGNAIVVKTSENVAWSSSHFAKAIQSCLAACGHDPDTVQVAIGCEAEAAKAFTMDERISHLTFIGSESIGREVARNAAETLTPVTLELGGKATSADVKFFQDVFLRSVFTGAGQGCIALERFIVHSAVYDEFLSIMENRVKDLQSAKDVGAMINGTRLAHLTTLVEQAVQEGARLLVGGTPYQHPEYPQSHYFLPTLLCDVTDSMAIAQQECFAPIMLVMRAESTDECIKLANGTRYALGSAVFGRNRADCRYVAGRLACGMEASSRNNFPFSQALPFGGTKKSGYGRFGGPEGLHLLIDEETKTAAAVDPYDVKKVIAAAEKEGVTIEADLGRSDHAGGNLEFKKAFPGVTVYGGSEQVAGLTKKVNDKDTFTVGNGIKVTGRHTPCHTQDSTCFFVEDSSKDQRGVFTGDTLYGFVGGCGRFFEGTAEEMDAALNGVLGSLPADTKVYDGHNYTQGSVAFGLSIDPNNEALKKLKADVEASGETTGKYNIADERKHNVFMRLTSEAVLEKTKAKTPVEAIGKLREMKNNFKG
ncbi:MAG: Meiotic Sister-Chromatid recombination aldehyde dehydrogenase [Cyphobasidiales sp. Tagirdzhanova-0007]|nr:MAG: Meiotic Sister-Chromatid recombination aldehyde dehydrogenase [Cyphobasidiales sp. Tagirdzhanova-0007]